MKTCIAVLIYGLLVGSMASAVTNIRNDEQLNAAFAKHRPMVIMLGNASCSACLSTKPAFVQAEQQLRDSIDFYYVDTDYYAIKFTKTVDNIPAFVVGSSDKAILNANGLYEGEMNLEHMLTYVKKHVH